MDFTLALLHRHLLADLGSLRLTLARLVVQPAVYLYVFGHVVAEVDRRQVEVRHMTVVRELRPVLR